jgi:hypothetical protein
VEITSLMENLIFKIAGMIPHKAPPRKPARKIRGTMIYGGKLSPKLSPVQVAKMAPIRSWPSAPIFQNFALKARVSPVPIKIRGMALVMVSFNPKKEPNDPEKISVIAKIGFTPEIRKRILITTRAAARDKILVINDRKGVILYLSVVLIFITVLHLF